jgi:hypothetical protein
LRQCIVTISKSKTLACKNKKQVAVLEKCRNLPVKNMLKWANDVKSGDPDNLEGRAAAFYWKNLFAPPVRHSDTNQNTLNNGIAVLVPPKRDKLRNDKVNPIVIGLEMSLNKIYKTAE